MVPERLHRHALAEYRIYTNNVANRKQDHTAVKVRGWALCLLNKTEKKEYDGDFGPVGGHDVEGLGDPVELIRLGSLLIGEEDLVTPGTV